MAVPTTMADLSVTANSNSPAGSESPISTDDFLRAHASILRHTNAKGADIASATTTDIGAATGEFVDVTGTTTITSLGTVAASIVRTVRFTGALTLTHNATSLILPGSANITTANGDVGQFRSLGSGNWKCVGYIKQDGSPVSFADNSITPAKLTAAAKTAKIQDIDASVSSNALTLTINPTTLDFRSTTLTDGTPTTVNLASAVTVVVPDGATLGAVNATAARLAVLAINNAGTIEAAVVNLAGGNNLDETGLISTTAIGTGSDSNNVIYSTSARTDVAYRVVGFIDITEATAGTWATAPTKVQGAGGQALDALSSLGYGQTWQSFTSGQRASGTTYYNTTGKPIMVSVSASGTSSGVTVTVNGVTIMAQVHGGTSQEFNSCQFIVPPGQSYSVSYSPTFLYWSELR